MNVIAGLAAILTIAQIPLSRQVVPRPTGENGYEEYLLAVDLVTTPACREFIAWRTHRDAVRRGAPPTDERGRPILAPRPPAGLLTASTELEVRRYGARLFPELLRLIRIGNRKPVSDPRAVLDAQTRFPELQHFRSLAMLAADAAYVNFADGSPRSGADALVEMLVMGNQVQGTSLVATLVGIAAQAVVFASFDRHLQAL